MGDRIASTIIYKLVADEKDLVASLKAAEKKTEALADSFISAGKKLSLGLTAPLLAAGAGMLKLASDAGNAADRLLDLEQITGLSTDTLQEFKNVAVVAGVDFESLVGSLTKFTGRLDEIEKGGGPAAEAVKSLGVNIRDVNGNVRSADELFPEFLSALNQIENVTERNAIAQNVFGRSLEALAPVLSLTAEQIANARKEARELGLVQSKDALIAANNYRIELDKLKLSIQGQAQELGQSLIPVVKDLIPIIGDIARAVTQWLKGFTELPIATQRTVLALAAVAAGIGPLLIGVGNLIKLFGTLKTAAVALQAPAALGALTAAGPVVAGVLAVVAAFGALAIAISKTRAAQDSLNKALTGQATLQQTFDELNKVKKALEDQEAALKRSGQLGAEVRKIEIERLKKLQYELEIQVGLQRQKLIEEENERKAIEAKQAAEQKAAAESTARAQREAAEALARQERLVAETNLIEFRYDTELKKEDELADKKEENKDAEIEGISELLDAWALMDAVTVEFFNKQEEERKKTLDGIEEEKRKRIEAVQAWLAFSTQAFGILKTIQQNYTNDLLAELDRELQATLKAEGVAEQTKLEKLNANLEATKAKLAAETDEAKRAELTKTQTQLENDIKREQITKEFEKKKADIVYKGQLAQWQLTKLQAVADSASAIIKAATSLPWPANLPAIGFASALGGLQLAAINGAKPAAPPAFAQGTRNFMVPPGFPNDSFPILVQSGERVTVETPQQQAGGGGDAPIFQIGTVIADPAGLRELDALLRKYGTVENIRRG